MSTPLVIDEWLISDLSGVNDVIDQDSAVNFINRLYRICDHFVILRNSPFHKKIFYFSEIANKDPLTKSIYSLFNRIIISNSKKFKIIENSALGSLSHAIDKITPDDDKYLLRLHLAIRGSIIITSDIRLIGKYNSYSFIKLFEKQKFIKDYLENNGISSKYLH